jgi:hypothetical protein
LSHTLLLPIQVFGRPEHYHGAPYTSNVKPIFLFIYRLISRNY